MNAPFLSRLCAVALALGTASSVAQDQPILESYVLGVGQNADGTAISQADRFFGGGTARATLTFLDTTRSQDANATTGNLSLFVGRRIRQGEVTPALLCSGVQIRGLDASGNEIFSKDLPGFSFGESKSGTYIQSVRKIPVGVSQLKVTFLGNYE